MGLDTVDLVHKLEVRFAISIPNSDAATIRTVADLYQTVLKQLSNDYKNSEVYEIIRQIIAEQTGFETYQIEPNQSLTNDLGLD